MLPNEDVSSRCVEPHVESSSWACGSCWMCTVDSETVLSQHFPFPFPHQGLQENYQPGKHGYKDSNGSILQTLNNWSGHTQLFISNHVFNISNSQWSSGSVWVLLLKLLKMNSESWWREKSSGTVQRLSHTFYTRVSSSHCNTHKIL